MSPVVELVDRCTAGWRTTEWLTVATWVFIAAFVSVEVMVIGRAEPDRGATLRRDGRTAAGMAAGALLVGMAYGAVFAILWSAVGRSAPGVLVGFWQRHPLVAALCAFVAWDLSGWIYHLVGHRTRLGWAAHSPHHSGSHYDATLALRLTWMPWHGLAHHPLLALAGFRFELILGCLAVSNALQAVQHSSALPPAPRWLAAVVMTPGAHRHHHGPDGSRRNLGPVFTIWDRLAGTWWPPQDIPASHEIPAAQDIPAVQDIPAAQHMPAVKDIPAVQDIPAAPRPCARSEPVHGTLGTQLAGWRQLVAGTSSPGRTGRL